MASEPDAAGAGQFNGAITTKGRFGRTRTSNIAAQFNFEVPGLGQVQQQLTGVSDALKELKATLAGMSSAFTTGPIVNMLKDISKEAAATSASLRDLSSSVSGVSGGGRGGGGGGGYSGGGNSTSSNAGIALATTASAGAAIAAAGGLRGGTGGGGAGTSATLNNMGSTMGGIGGLLSGGSLLSKLPVIGTFAGAAADLAMLPLRFSRERIQNNRVQALGMSQELTPYQWSTGMSTTNMMGSLASKFPSNIQGDVSDILTALTVGRRSGAQFGFGGEGGARAPGFFNSISQMQMITPGVGAGQLAQTLGNQVGNTASQQASAFYTGGAFSMVGANGGQKSIAEWSEGILRFLEGQRPGNKRGVKFNYGELLAQNFPGSNVNAWFATVGISPDMMDYFWSYALGQAQTGSTDIFEKMGGRGGDLTSNQAWRRLGSQNALTRNEFGLAGRMGGQYANREQSNQWFNQAMGAIVNRLVPALAQALGPVQYLPDQVEDFLWNALESSGPLIQGIMGSLSIAGTAQQLGTAASHGVPGGAGLGDYDSQGGRTTAGLTPDMRKKVGAMMQANPRLSMTSGLRDSYTQQKLKAKGIGQFGARNNKSPHFAGEAADLGPSSQYGWIQANAHRFGLQAATKHGEPWHVQRAGTMGDPGIGDGVSIGGIVGGAAGWLGSNIPVIGGAIDAAGDVFGILKQIYEMFKTVFKSALDAAAAAKQLAEVMNPADIINSGKGGGAALAAGVSKTSSAFLSLLTGGLNASGGVQGLIRDGGGSGAYDAGFATGLPTSINLTNYSTSGMINANPSGTPMGAGPLGSGTLSEIYSKYAAGTPSSSRSADAATAGRIRNALAVASEAGFTGEELITFVALAGRESNFTPTAYNGNTATGDNSYGMWQINTLGGMWEQMAPALGLTNKQQLLDPLTNAKAGKYLFDQSSTPFRAWGPYKQQPPLHGGAEQWVAPVYAIAREAGYIGDPGYGDTTSSGGHTFIFRNEFNLGGLGGGQRGGSGDLDVSRLVPLLADKLEAEMKRRLVGAR